MRSRTCSCSLLKLKSDGTALSFSTRLLHCRLKQSLVKCWEQMLLYLVGLKFLLFMADTHFPQMSGRARGNLSYTITPMDYYNIMISWTENMLCKIRVWTFCLECSECTECSYSVAVTYSVWLTFFCETQKQIFWRVLTSNVQTKTQNVSQNIFYLPQKRESNTGLQNYHLN